MWLTPREEEILWRAAENPSIVEAVRGDALTAIKAVRELLIKFFPEIKELPRRYPDGTTVARGSSEPPRADFWVAKALCELLREA